MPRVAVLLHCEPQVRQELERLSRSRTDEARLVERAQIILACLSGKRNDEVAREHNTQPGTVGVWRKRFAAKGLAGLYDKARPGKPPKYKASELNWKNHRHQAWRHGMAAPWLKNWLSRMMPSGAYCVKKVSSFDVTVHGALVQILNSR